VLSLKAQYEAAANTPGNEETMEHIVDQIKTIVASNDNDSTPSVQVYAASVLLAAGQTKEALTLVHTGSSMEQIALCLQIYLKMDRLDLAQQQFNLMKRGDEDAVLTQLGHVYVALATGASGAADALHTVNQLSEQYGSSPLLLNLQAAALMLQGDYATAESKLQECLRDYSDVAVIPDTLVNLVVCTVHNANAANNKMATIQGYVGHMQQQFPSHPFLAGLDRVTSAFDREAIKYKV
jgi:coatomer subunit epsilon